MTDTKPFDGKLALVTGASRGIGAATAEALAAAGAHVIITARGASALEQVEARIHAAGGTATIAPMSTRSPINGRISAQPGMKGKPIAAITSGIFVGATLVSHSSISEAGRDKSRPYIITRTT